MFEDTLPKDPDKLIAKGYKRVEGEMDEVGAGVQKVWFRKRIARLHDESLSDLFMHIERPCSLVFDIMIQYELTIGDDPDATWEQNCSYYYEETILKVWRRTLRASKEDEDDEDDEDEGQQRDRPDREELTPIGSQKLHPRSFQAIENFAEMLGYTPS